MKLSILAISFYILIVTANAQYSRKQVRGYMNNHVPTGWVSQPINKNMKCNMIFKKYMQVDPGMNADYNYEQRHDTITLYITLEPVHGKNKQKQTEQLIQRMQTHVDTLIAESKRNRTNSKEDYIKYHGAISSERYLIRLFRYIHTPRYSFRWNYTWEGATTIETTEIKTEVRTIVKTLEEYLKKK